jgi:hypothetical protein
MFCAEQHDLECISSASSRWIGLSVSSTFKINRVHIMKIVR